MMGSGFSDKDGKPVLTSTHQEIHETFWHPLVTSLATSLVQVIGFAVDLEIVSRMHNGVVDTFISLKRDFKRIGLIINDSKTKSMKTSQAIVRRQLENKVFFENQTISHLLSPDPIIGPGPEYKYTNLPLLPLWTP